MRSNLMSDPVFDVWDGSTFLNVTNLMMEEANMTTSVLHALENFILSVNENYYIRDQLMPFHGACKTIGQYVEAGGLDFYTTTEAQTFYLEKHVDTLYQNDILNPWQRAIYGQELNGSNLFSSFASLTCLEGSQQCTEGNDELVKALFAKYKTSVSLSTTVTHITQSQNSFVIQFTPPDGIFKQEFDTVVLAAPIEVANVTFVNMTLPPLSYRRFEHWFVTIVLAKGINPAYFGVSTVPSFICTTTNASTPWVSISYVAQAGSGNATYYKIFSKQDVSMLINDLFLNMQWNYVQMWPYTFPRLIPMGDPDYQPILLSQNLYYLNGMESIASAMETSVAAGRNVALLFT